MGGNLKTGFGFNAGGGGGGTDTNTNVANADLTLDGNHTTDVGANTLTFDSGTTNIAQLVGSDDTLSIGGAAPYKMPTARAGLAGYAIQSTNTTTGTSWKPTGFQLPFSMYIQGADSLTYYYPEPMSNNKFLALTRDSGVSAPGDWNVLTSTTFRSATLGGSPRNFHIGALNGWVSVLDNASTNTPAITVEVWRITPSEGSTAQLVPSSVISATSNATGDSNNKLYLLRATTGGDVSANDILMPVWKVATELEEVNLDVWINGSITCYYT